MEFPGTDIIKPRKGDEAVMLNFRIRPEFRRIVHRLAEAEGVGVGDLACEGIARVLAARLETGELRDVVETSYQRELEAIAEQKALLESITLSTD